MNATTPMQVIAPGTAVKIGGDVPAVVTGVTIRANGVSQYEVTWWSGTTRTCAWVEPSEVTADGTELVTIGFTEPPPTMTPGERRILAKQEEIVGAIDRARRATANTY